MKYIVGHRNPDTDSVVSTILLSNLLGDNYLPSIANELNKETKYVLDLLKIPQPVKISSDCDACVLVDHNEPNQMSPEVSCDKVEMIVDHHKLGGLALSTPITVKIEPVGSTCTIICKLFKENNKQISQQQASLMLAGIISDTLNLKSPITTEEDVEAVKQLKAISDFNVDNLASGMFKAKSDLTGVSIETVVNQDYKNFEIAGKKVGFGVFETVSPESALERVEEIFTALKNKKQAENTDYMFFAVVDIVGEMAYLMLLSKMEEDLALRVYRGKSNGKYMILPGIVSRKKQMIPVLEKTLKNA